MKELPLIEALEASGLKPIVIDENTDFSKLSLPTYEVQSPFLPGTQIQFAWDSTSLGYIKTCGRLYQYIMIEGWTAKDESVHLRFGQEYHSAIEGYERAKANGATHEDAIREAVLDTLRRTIDYAPDESLRAGKYKNRQRLISLIIDYFDKYKDDVAQTMILDNGVPAVELSFRFELDWGPKAAQWKVGDKPQDDPRNFWPKIEQPQPYLLSGHLDRVVTYNSELFVMDHKTSLSTLGGYFFDQFAPHNQMTLYTLASQVILEAPIKGVIIDAAQILLEKPNHFQRGLTYRTKDQINEWVDDLQYWFSLAEQFATNNYWPMNDTACGMYGGCKFRDVCSKSPQVRDSYLKAQFDKLEPEDRWNPIRPRGPK